MFGRITSKAKHYSPEGMIVIPEHKKTPFGVSCLLYDK
jgi:hypothetical protein